MQRFKHFNLHPLIFVPALHTATHIPKITSPSYHITKQTHFVARRTMTGKLHIPLIFILRDYLEAMTVMLFFNKEILQIRTGPTDVIPSLTLPYSKRFHRVHRTHYSSGTLETYLLNVHQQFEGNIVFMYSVHCTHSAFNGYNATKIQHYTSKSVCLLTWHHYDYKDSKTNIRM